MDLHYRMHILYCLRTKYYELCQLPVYFLMRNILKTHSAENKETFVQRNYLTSVSVFFL